MVQNFMSDLPMFMPPARLSKHLRKVAIYRRGFTFLGR
jgi:hypothetical protein